MSDPKQSIMNRSLRGAGHFLVVKTLSQPVTLLATILLVRSLSEAHYGIYQLFQSALSLIGMAASLGLANTVQRFVPEFLAKGQFRLAWDLYRIASLLRLLINILLLGLTLTFWDWLAPHFGLENYRDLFMIFSLFLLLDMQNQLLEICLYGYFLHKQVQLIAMLLSSIRVCGYTAVIVLHWDLIQILVIDLVGHLVSFILLRLTMVKKIPAPAPDDPVRIGKEERKRFFNYAKYYNFNDLGAGILGNKFDNFFVAAFLDPVTVGGYVFCNRIAGDVEKFIPTNYFMSIIKSTLFSFGNTLRATRIRRVYQSLAKINYLFNVPILCFMASAGGPFIDVVFGGRFRGFVPILLAVLTFQTLDGFFKAIDTIAQLRERADIILISKLFAIPNIIGNLLLLPLIGLWGPVFSTGFSQLGRVLFIWYSVRDAVSFKGMGKTFGITCLFWGGVSLVAQVVNRQVANPTFSLLLSLLIFGAALPFFIRLELFNRFEKVLLRDFTRRQPKIGRIFNRLGMRL